MDMVLVITNKVKLKTQNVKNMDMEPYNIQPTIGLYTHTRHKTHTWKISLRPYFLTHLHTKHTQIHTLDNYHKLNVTMDSLAAYKYTYCI